MWNNYHLVSLYSDLHHTNTYISCKQLISIIHVVNSYNTLRAEVVVKGI